MIPFAFDPASGTASRIRPSSTDEGGLTLRFYIEPHYSLNMPGHMFGATGWARRTIDEYDLNTDTYTQLLNLDDVMPDLADTYVGGVSSGGKPNERILAFFGGESQDLHHYVVVFDRNDPASRHHSSWHNAQPGQLVPFISGIFRCCNDTVEWRPWDNEIVAIETGMAPGVGARVWRLAHHRIWFALLDEEGATARFGPPKRKRRLGDPEDHHHRFLVRRGSEDIGVADIYENRPAAVCHFVLGLLPPYRRRKLGAVTARLMLRHAFEKLDARRVESSVLATNPASIEMQDGMVQEGVLRRRVLVHGEEVDELLFAMLRWEWNVARMRRGDG